jgi:hypothetical protein
MKKLIFLLVYKNQKNIKINNYKKHRQIKI